MSVTGRTYFAGLPALIQVAEINRKNCVITITEKGMVGKLSIWDGVVRAAEAGELRGPDAAVEVFGWVNSNFQMELIQEEPEKEITEGNFSLLMRGAQRLSATAEVARMPAWQLTGDLETLSVLEILQLLELNRQPARLRVRRNGDLARVVFRDGRVLHAENGDKTGEETIYEVLTWTSGRFELDRFTGATPETVVENIPSLIVEGMRRVDEQKLREERERRRLEELSEKTLKELEGGELSPERRIALAKRYLPRGGTAPVEAVLNLLHDPDIRVRQHAIETLRKLPDPVLKGVLIDPEASDSVLFHLATRFADDEEVIKPVLRNRRVSDATIARIAARASASVLELIKADEKRVANSEHIRAAIARNEQSGAKETSPEKAEKEEIAERERRGCLKQQLSELSFADKLFIAEKGTSSQRMVLVRNPDRRIAVAVLNSTRTTDGEVETIAHMKSVNPEVLAEITERSEWSNQYPIAKALVFNPKTPATGAANLVRKLREIDLRAVWRNRDLHEIVRIAAQKRLRSYEQKRKL